MRHRCPRLQEATFRYFWDHAHPISGLAFERGRTGKRPDIRQLCWRMFMQNPEIAPALEAMGWRRAR